MTKRLTLTLIAVALIVLTAGIPVSADSAGSGGAVPPGGEVTIIAKGDQNPSIDGKIVISLGDKIELAGTNTATDQTYLFITGPGLAASGSQIQNTDPGHSAVENGNPDTFKQISVKSDHTWSWMWDTTSYALDEGTYTIYIVPKPNDTDHLAPIPYGTVSIIIKKSAESATSTPSTTSPSTLAEKGYVTIVAHGDPNHSLGDEIVFSGTNTESSKTYLFITGPGLAASGSQIQNTDPGHSAVENGNPDTFKQMDVQGDHTWSWKWGTSNTVLDDGTYTIYAVARPNDKGNLEKTAYGTTSITIKNSTKSPMASQSPTSLSTITRPITTKPTAAAAIPNPSAPTTTPTRSPGFGALIALISLGAVTFVFVRRH